MVFNFFIYLAIRSGQDPTVNRTIRDHQDLLDTTYCSQGEFPTQPREYGRCCPSGMYWNNDTKSCEEANPCTNCNEEPFSSDWWNNTDCFGYDNGKITYTCHPTDFFGDNAYYEFKIEII